VIERLRGTPQRVIERTAALSACQRTHRIGRLWSVQEQVGHLLDLEPLWMERARAILDGRPRLDPEHTRNRRTVLAAHNTHSYEGIVSALVRARAALVEVFERATDAELVRSSWHPRLDQPMTLVDLALYAAEHDDHHLATIAVLRTALGDVRVSVAPAFATEPVAPVAHGAIDSVHGIAAVV
jgi:uncharacterized damage-inducible protein DinB